MNAYLLCLGLSFGGLVLMSLMGLGHHHHAGYGHAHGGKGLRHPHGQHHHGGGSCPGRALFLLGWFSPRVLFSVLMGFGATGALVESLTTLPAMLVCILAVVGGVAFERFVVAPFWNLLFGFASKPARTLETALFGSGEAATDFDRTGHGLVRLELDGQVRQILGTLAPDERVPDAPRVRTGERLFIRSVDHRRNVCTVSRLGC